jgi:hypothetical protein
LNPAEILEVVISPIEVCSFLVLRLPRRRWEMKVKAEKPKEGKAKQLYALP